MEADFPYRWRTIVFTSPEAVEGEAAKIVRLLEGGAASAVHIRKPGWSAAQVAGLLAEIPPAYHRFLRLHDRFELCSLFPRIGGVHLNSRCPEPPAGELALSASCHSLVELDKAERMEYVTLSPVFDSISKPGYSSAFNMSSLPAALAAHRNVVALGGVRPEHFRRLRKAGFCGAALLGYVWDDFEKALPQMCKHYALTARFPLQFITDGRDVEETLRQVRQALAGSCRWIQIRMKDAPPERVYLAAAAAVTLCREAGATLLVDDHVEIARRLGIGVHLGKDDMPASEARAILGPDAIIGSTCNCAADIEAVRDEGASDYIGLGPYRFTTTKKRLAPVIGEDGYRRLLSQDRLHRLPVVAIGGITQADVAAILHAGADGVAVSGAITRADHPVAAAKELVNEIYKTL